MICGGDIRLSEWLFESLRSVELAPVDPRPTQGLILDEMMVAMKPPPMAWVRYKALFDRVLGDVFKDVLQRLFIKDLLAEIWSLPKGFIPVMNLAKLTREVALKVAHKTREVCGLMRAQQEVKVVAQEG